MDLLFAATELAPYAKVGGLADVIAALTKTLRQHGHKVTLVLPRYPHFERAGLLVARRLSSLAFELGGRAIGATVYDGRLPSGVDITLLDVPGFFDRPGIYGETGADYPDNPQRFATFCRAVVELVAHRARDGQRADVVHVHDWTTALVPLYAKSLGVASAASARFVLTVHNLAYQGVVDAAQRAPLGIPDEHFHPEGVEFYGGVNVLKAGLVFSDLVTTVSESYAREIQTPEQGCRLEGVLGALRERLHGIPNGIDYALWNPATDASLAARYDAEDAAGKARCKTALLTRCGLELAADRPVVAVAGRLVEQKGVDLVVEAWPKLARTPAAFVVAGDGDPRLVERLATLAAKAPERIAFLHAPADADLHRAIAGADMVLVPSRFEPCGLVQQYGQRYGAVPIAHATGGLLDTIVDCDESLETGTGFLFAAPRTADLVGGVQRAAAAYASPRWPRLLRRVMRLDLGWDRSARRYEQLYRSLVG
jgi:starch synthase